MIRLKISNFIRKHKHKIKDLIRKLLIVAMGVFIATIILSILSNMDNSDDKDKSNAQNVYKPTETIIKGPNVSKEQYEEDKNLVNTFLEYCNNKEVEKAYALISEECKKEVFPTIDFFKDNYYNYVFGQERQCTLQSYISTGNYTVYRVRYLNNMLETGIYNENDIYQDYITLNRKNNKESISIGKFVDSKELRVVTKTDELEAIVLKKSIYLSYEEYEISIKNNTEKTILLNNLKDAETIGLIGGSGNRYNALTSKLFLMDLIIEPNHTKTISIRFMKELSSNNVSTKIQFLDIIKDYNIYMQNKNEYKDTTSITIKAEE